VYCPCLALAHHRPTEAPGQPCVDLSEEVEERFVLASFDPLAAMATTDEAKLRERLAVVSGEPMGTALSGSRSSIPWWGLARRS
jgi:hypothetical protein